VDKYKPFVERIAQLTGTGFHPASSESLARLRELNCPEAAVRFYQQYEPEPCEVAKVRLDPVAGIVLENTQGVPGICVRPYGYLVFATTYFGDAYCFNANKLDGDGEPEIILVSHEAVSENSTEQEVNRVVKPVASSLAVFLDQFAKGELDMKCIY
jgi:hypothetical protein